VLRLPVPEIQTLIFVYLMYSAQATIYLARVGGRFWSVGREQFRFQAS
jgi:H+-transporting ATPase